MQQTCRIIDGAFRKEECRDVEYIATPDGVAGNRRVKSSDGYDGRRQQGGKRKPVMDWQERGGVF